MTTQSPMTYGYDPYGDIIEQPAPIQGQGFNCSDGIVFFEEWDKETGFARCTRASDGVQFLCSPDYLHWMPAYNRKQEASTHEKT